MLFDLQVDFCACNMNAYNCIKVITNDMSIKIQITKFDDNTCDLCTFLLVPHIYSVYNFNLSTAWILRLTLRTNINRKGGLTNSKTIIEVSKITTFKS